MISEVRYLLFDEQDLLRAMIDYRKVRNQPLPAGSISEFKIQRKQPVTCTLTLQEDQAGHTTDVIFTNNDMRAALVSYCIDKKVPMPAKADKDLQVFGKRIGMLISLNLTESENDALRRRVG